ncbi:dihydrofolate reductase family protein [Streptomyces sp. NPDC101132]|uniref:dihydrofolate reductase family protein n=1 Tax=Streptomyces sp. NPDC101132 TaxID=3366110 RepID=UPI0037FD485D
MLRGADVVGQVRRLEEQPGGELQAHGSRQLVRTLHDAGLVDVHRLIQFPVVVGAGKRLFGDGAVPSVYRITESHVAAGGSGAVALTLRRTASGTTGAGEFVVREGKEAAAWQPAGNGSWAPVVARRGVTPARPAATARRSRW